MVDGADRARATVAGLDGLATLWAGATARAPAPDTSGVPIRTLLDTLGLGLGQTLAYLSRERPEWPEFLDWIAATAGPPDAAALDRYAAWSNDAPMPAAERERQARVMSADPVFDAGDLAAWERDGVVVLRNAIGKGEAAAIAAHLWKAIDADPGDPATWCARSGSIMTEVFQHSSMEVPRRSPRVRKAFAQLYGHADLMVSVDRLSFNPPERPGYTFQGPHLHWDANLTQPMRFEAQGILYLTATAANGGALQVVPGFHHRLATWLHGVDGDPRQVDLSAQAVTVSAGAGDLVIWRQELPHGASANRSPCPRLAQYVTMYPQHRPDLRRWL